MPSGRADLFTGDAVAIVMADASDYAARTLSTTACWRRATTARSARASARRDRHGYPRQADAQPVRQLAIRALFRHGYGDTTNAFKAYRREVIESVSPLLSSHFNLTVELPLKAIMRGHSYAIVPISWRNRTAGDVEAALKEMGSRYLFVVLYVFLEYHLTRGDYRPPTHHHHDRPGHLDHGSPRTATRMRRKTQPAAQPAQLNEIRSNDTL